MSTSQSPNILEKQIAGFLHDPLDKALCIISRKSHVNRAKEIAEKLKLSSNIINEIKHHHRPDSDVGIADTYVALANRFLIPHGLQVNDIYLQNPFSARVFKTEMQISLAPPSNVANNLNQKIQQSESAQASQSLLTKLYLHLLEAYYEAYGGHASDFSRIMMLIPEDTRTPSAPMFSHLQAVSAFSASVKDRMLCFTLLMFDLGGVQEFISTSRKTRDLWASSYIMALMSFAAVLPIVKRYGPVSIISPWLMYQPLFRALHEKIEDGIVYPSMPNSFIAVIPSCEENEIKEIVQQIKESMKQAWDALVNCFIEHLQNMTKTDIDEDLIKSQLNFEEIFYKVRISTTKIGSSEIYRELKKGEEEIIKKLLADHNKIVEKGEEGGIIEYASSLTFSESQGCVSQGHGVFFHKGVEDVGLRTASIKYAVEAEFQELSSQKSKCDACGFRNALNLSDFQWKELEIAGVVDYDERLCPLCLLRRMFKDIAPCVLSKLTNENLLKDFKEKIFRKELKIPSTADIAVSWFKATLIALYHVLDGDKKDKLAECVAELKAASKALTNSIRQSYPDGFLARTFASELQIEKKVRLKFLEILESRVGEEEKAVAEDIASLPAIALKPEELISLLEKVHYWGTDEEKKKFEDLKKLVEPLVDYAKKLLDFVKEIAKDENVLRKAKEFLADTISSYIGHKRYIDEAFNLKENIPLSVSPSDSFVLLRADGDNMGDWITGNMNLPAYLFYIGDEQKLKKAIRNSEAFKQAVMKERRVSPAHLLTLSSSISLNTRVIRSVVEAFGGFLIFSGGDDVLALLPPETWLYAYALIRLMFSREISLEMLPDNLYVYIYGLGWRATISFSAAIADTKADLRMVLRTVSNGLDKAKELTVYLKAKDSSSKRAGTIEAKDGITIYQISRSGIVREAILPNIIVRKRKDGITGKFYTIRELDNEFRARIVEKIENISKNGEHEEFSVFRIRDNFMPSEFFYGADSTIPRIDIVALKPSLACLTSRILEGVYIPALIAEKLAKMMKYDEELILSKRALYEISKYYKEIHKGAEVKEDETTHSGATSEFIEAHRLLLKQSLRRKVEEKAEETDAFEFFCLALKEFEDFQYEIEDKTKNLLEVVEAAIMIERALRNTV